MSQAAAAWPLGPGGAHEEQEFGVALLGGCSLEQCSCNCSGGLSSAQFVFSIAIEALRAGFPPHCVCKGGWCGEKGVKPLLGLSTKCHVQSSPKGVPLESSQCLQKSNTPNLCCAMEALWLLFHRLN